MSLWGNKDTKALTGTVAATNNSTAVVGTSTVFLADPITDRELKEGNVILIDSVPYRVKAIADATNITIDPAYVGTRITIPTSGVTIGTDTIAYDSHGLLADDAVTYSRGPLGTETVLAGLADATKYYVAEAGLTTGAFELKTSAAKSDIKTEYTATITSNDVAGKFDVTPNITLAVGDRVTVTGTDTDSAFDDGDYTGPTAVTFKVSAVTGGVGAVSDFTLQTEADAAITTAGASGGTTGLTFTAETVIDLTGTGNNDQYFDYTTAGLSISANESPAYTIPGEIGDVYGVDTAEKIAGRDQILSFVVADGGTLYVEAPPVSITASTGTDATGTAVISGGAVTSITLTEGGTKYEDIEPLVTIPKARLTCATSTVTVGTDSVDYGSAHGLSAGDALTYNTGPVGDETAITNLTHGDTVYVATAGLTTDVFEVKTTTAATDISLSTITSNDVAGKFDVTPAITLAVGDRVTVSGTDTDSAFDDGDYTGPTEVTFKVSAVTGGVGAVTDFTLQTEADVAITTAGGSGGTTGLTFTAETVVDLAGTGNNFQYFEKDASVAATANAIKGVGEGGAIAFALSTVVATAATTNGTIGCDSAAIKRGDRVVVTGAAGGAGTITGYASGTTYLVKKILAGTEGTSVTQFIMTDINGDAIETTAGSLTMTFSVSTGSDTTLTHVGWVQRRLGTGGRAGRVSYETLVAMSSITGDAEDTVFPDS